MTTRSRPVSVKVRLLAVPLVLLALLVGACSSSDKKPSTTTTSVKTTSTAVNIPTSVPNDVAVRQDVTMGSCAAAPGGWQASGTITNNRGHDATYSITVFFTSDAATDLAFATASVPVSAGKSAPWSA